MMNREILFKAKRKDNDKWVEGDYCKLDETTYCISEDYERYPVPTHHYILHEAMTDWGLPNRFLQFEINPDTLCQFTGLTDKNGKKIWENDILRRDGYWDIRIEFENGVFMVRNADKVQYINRVTCTSINTFNIKSYEVVGNIFDNADLLEVE